MYVADERKWREKADVPFHLAFTLRDLGERANAARCDIVDPGACLGYGEENRVPGFLFERRLGLELGVFAEFETNLRRERQLEGIAKAKAAGVYSRWNRQA
jgi:hypothetical protein